VAGLPAPTLRTIVLPASIDLVAAVLTVATAAAYVVGVRRLSRRGRQWPFTRSAAFLAGIGVLVLATQTGIARYDAALFSVHVVQHVLLSMVAPVLLVLGAPVTLALQASRPSTRRPLRRALHHPAVRFVTSPIVATTAFALTPFILYFSSLYDLSLRNGVVHAWVHVHMVVVGSLFAAVVVGVDPLPGRWPHGLRLLLVGLTVPVHAVLGVALLSSNQPLAADWYASITRTWGASPLADQHTGAGVLWAAGEVVAVTLALIVVAQWMQASEREARRTDRRLDAALAGRSS
jgi:putative membrane protein